MSKDSKIFILIFALVALAALLLFLSSCNPVKRVIKDPFKMQQVFDEGVKLGWCVNDSVYVSDTTVLFDTLHVFETVSDTLVMDRDSIIYVNRVSYKTVTKTVTIRDTTIVTDKKKEKLLQKEVSKLLDDKVKLKQSLINLEAAKLNMNKQRNKWRLYFWLLVAAIGVMIFRKPLLSLITPVGAVLRRMTGAVLAGIVFL